MTNKFSAYFWMTKMIYSLNIITMETIDAVLYERGYKCNGEGSKGNVSGGDKTWMIEYQRRICI